MFLFVLRTRLENKTFVLLTAAIFINVDPDKNIFI